MASARIRSGLPLLNRILRSDSLSTQRPAIQRSVLTPAFTAFQPSKNLSTSSVQKGGENQVAYHFIRGNWKLCLCFVRSGQKDLSVRADTRVKAINEICATAKFSDITKNFLVIVAENGRLNHLESIVNKFKQLTMADKGIVKAMVTTVMPLPPQEEKELKETLQDIIGHGKTVQVEQKIDPSILGGIMIEFEQKLFDMSIRTRAKQMERFLREPVDFDAL
ncbi:hypothetical protein OIU84_008835 [Salix udensis]|uniref:Uncharacterized protein n=1 Tax=Salix udensis TaxID=889485 RepID=A0AAD6JPZ3_9ROSI|nr:hypothetical protein OIU84_008835 [Salix udensis]